MSFTSTLSLCLFLSHHHSFPHPCVSTLLQGWRQFPASLHVVMEVEEGGKELEEIRVSLTLVQTLKTFIMMYNLYIHSICTSKEVHVHARDIHGHIYSKILHCVNRSHHSSTDVVRGTQYIAVFNNNNLTW